MNCRVPVTWTKDDDGTGQPIGLRDKVDTTKDLTLNRWADHYGVRVEALMQASGLENGKSKPDPGIGVD